MLTIDQILRVNRMMAQDSVPEPRELPALDGAQKETEGAIRLILGYAKTPGGDVTIRSYDSEEERLSDPNRVE